MRDEYDFSDGVRGKHVQREFRYLRGTHPDRWFTHTTETLDRLAKDPDYEVRVKVPEVEIRVETDRKSARTGINMIKKGGVEI